MMGANTTHPGALCGTAKLGTPRKKSVGPASSFTATTDNAFAYKRMPFQITSWHDVKPMSDRPAAAKHPRV